MRGHKFHYSPYLVDSSAESGTWVATVGTVLSYGIPAVDADEDEEAEVMADAEDLRVWPLRSVCWGRWLPKRIAGECFRAGTEG